MRYGAVGRYARRGRPGIPAHILGSGADNPAVGDQAVPAGHDRSPYPSGASHMLRLQAPLPDRYTLATPDELDGWIARGQGRRSATGS